MMRRFALVLAPAVLLAAGCATPQSLQRQIEILQFDKDSGQQAVEQAAINERLAQRETALAKNGVRVMSEKLRLAYDALRVANAKLDEGLHDRLTELSQASDGEALSISKYGGVVLKSSVLFRAGSHTLTAAGKRALDPLARTLLQAKYDGYDIEVAGHTDSDPIKRTKKRYRDNWDLGAMRANSVRRYLSDAGLPKDRLLLSAWGFTRPLGDKARNRRVEVMLRKTAIDSVPANQVQEFERVFLSHVRADHADLLESIRVDKEWTPELAKAFDDILARQVKEFIA